MAYSAWSVVYGEQPSAAKWNILGSNDASFNDGTGIGTNAITGDKLSTGAVLLGKASRASSQSSITSETDLTDLTTGAITVPAGGRSALVLFSTNWTCPTGGARIALYVYDGATKIGKQQLYVSDTVGAMSFTGHVWINAPSAGSHTYHLHGACSGGTAANYGDAEFINFITALLI